MKMPCLSEALPWLACDLLCLNAGWLAGFWLYRGGPGPALEAWLAAAGFLALVHGSIPCILGVYRRLWRQAGARDLAHFMLSETVAAVILRLTPRIGQLPLLEFILVELSAWTLMLGCRLVLGLVRDNRARFGSGVTRVLVAGAGEAGRIVVRELRCHPERRLRPVAFADDSPRKQGLVIEGLPVICGREGLERAAARFKLDQIIIAMPSAGKKALSEWAREASRTKARARIVPSLREFVSGRVDLGKVRDIRPEDLLGRPPVEFRPNGEARYINGRVVLVSGAGGSIGSELCRQLSLLEPRLLVLLGNEENQLHELTLDLASGPEGASYRVVLGDIRDRVRMEQVFARYEPDVVFHAAAHKHVPILEDNPEEAVKNNVVGTMNLALAARAVSTEVFVNVSTDKAAEPISVMGASKCVAEMIAQSLNALGGTRFVVVRFGNVLGSRGSVLPIFQRQVSEGGPVTVTDPQATRYFMTVTEACRLLIQSVASGREGQVLILDMGEPVRIMGLAENVIRLAGREPGYDIPIRVTGLRPGEKLHEELVTPYEAVSATAVPGVLAASQPVLAWATLKPWIERLGELASTGDSAAVRAFLLDLAGRAGPGSGQRPAAAVGSIPTGVTSGVPTGVSIEGRPGSGDSSCLP